MADSEVPALSPIKSPKRPRDYGSPVNEIPDAEPAPKKHKADEGNRPFSWSFIANVEAGDS